MSSEQPRFVLLVVALLAAPLAFAAYLDRDGSVTKENSRRINGYIVDRLVDGTGAIFDGKGAVWVCISEDEAKRFANAFSKRGFKCERDN